MQQPVGIDFRADFHGSARAKQLQKLGANSFAREAGKAFSLTDGRRTNGGIERAFTEIGRKAEEAQDAQMVLFDAPRGSPMNRTSAPRCREATRIIEEPSARRHGQGIHREIAAKCVDPKIAAEADFRMAAIGRNILAERRHFKGLFPGERVTVPC